MPPLYLDVRGGEGDEFDPMGYVSPGGKPEVLSNNKPDGTKESIIFECSPDNSSSTVSRVPQIAGDVRTQVDVLREGDTPLIIDVRKDGDLNVPYQIRFTHKMV